MKITLIREDRESGKETLSTCEADAWIDRIKTETKEEHVTRLRSMLLYTNPDSGGYYEHIDKLPRIYPSVEFGRSWAKTETLQRRSDAGGLLLHRQIDLVISWRHITLFKEHHHINESIH